MSTTAPSLAFKHKRAQIVAARKLLNDVLQNDHLIANLPDHLPNCTCGSVMQTIINFRKDQFDALNELVQISGLKLSTIESTLKGIDYVAHSQKWRLTRRFRNLDALEDWVYPIVGADLIAMDERENRQYCLAT